MLLHLGHAPPAVHRIVAAGNRIKDLYNLVEVIDELMIMAMIVPAQFHTS